MTAGTARARSFRGDIEGLRAVAVAIVVLAHAGVTSLGGGYAGVDVFFVISGFLITSLLFDELERTGRVSLLGFYARRAKRILPAAALVIAVTVVAAYLSLGVLRGRQTALDGEWAALFGANVHAIRQGTDYFAQGDAPSLLQHYWSLAVEEQFYLVWPTLLVALWFVGRRIRRPQATVTVAVCAVLGGSLWWSIVQTAAAPTRAYFSPFTRAWELAAGAALAIAPIASRRWPGRSRAVATWLGLAGIAVTAVWFDASTAFPGYAALLPVTSTALVIAAGAGAAPMGAGIVLGLQPVRWLGRISYSLYLWHWPVLILAAEVSGRSLSALDRAGCVLVAVALAQVSFVLVERPVRSWSWLAGSARQIARAPSVRAREWLGARRALGLGALAVTVALVCSLAVVRNANVAINTAAHAHAPLPTLFGGPTEAAANAEPIPRPSSRSGPSTRSSTAPTTTPASPAVIAQRFTAAQARVEAAVRGAAGLSTIPSSLDPPVLQLRTLGRPWYYWRCMEGVKGSVQCVYGDPRSTKTVFLLGDSHAGEWLPAVEQVARQRHLRLVTLAKASCPPIEDVEVNRQDGSPFPACQTWNEAVRKRIAATHPYAVLVTFSRYPGIVFRGPLATWQRGLEDELRDLGRSGARVVEIGGNGGPPQPPDDCLSRHADPRDCSFAPTGFATQRAQDVPAVTAAGARYIDVEPWFCAGAHCPTIIDNRAVYFDINHISAQYALDIAPMLGLAFDEALTP